MPTWPNVPDDPLPLVQDWLDAAAVRTKVNPWAMALATTAADGNPACRFVLLKGLDTKQGFAVFYTNYGSRKARELEGSQVAAAALYWPDAGRQLRFEGHVTRSPPTESDVYFASRPRASQLNAWASRQSSPLPPGGMEQALAEVESGFPASAPVPRPPHWGGYRIWLAAIEFWVEGGGRFHERVRYERSIAATGAGGYTGGDWSHVRLQP